MNIAPKPISLSEAQTALIRQAAKALPQEQRTKFLDSLADTLLMYELLTDEVVAQAATNVLSRLFGGQVTS